MCIHDNDERAPPRCGLRQLNVFTGIKALGWMFRRFHPGVYVLRQTGSCFSSPAACLNDYMAITATAERRRLSRRFSVPRPFFLHAAEPFSALATETDDGFATPAIRAGKASVMETCIKESSCTAVCLSRSQEGEAASHIDLSVVLRNFETASAAAFRKTG